MVPVKLFQLCCMFNFLMKRNGENYILILSLGSTDVFEVPYILVELMILLKHPSLLFSFSEKAYLCRVAYYGLKGRYSKAILNCNEAIRLYPESVRAYICRGVLKYYNRVSPSCQVY